jgi:CheY-like chemotaxis protein
VVVITARDLTAADRARLNSGVEGILTKKAFTPSQLVEKLHKLLPEKRQAEEAPEPAT